MVTETISKDEVVEIVKKVLASRGLSLYQVSQISQGAYGKSSRYFVPHNWYHDLRLRTYSPSPEQVFALSKSSGYHVRDWLRIFGFDLSTIPRLQIHLPSRRTLLLDSSLDDPESWISWFKNNLDMNPVPDIAPLGQILGFSTPRQLHSLASTLDSEFLYAKIGQDDAFAFPDLVPGAIVRANTKHFIRFAA